MAADAAVLVEAAVAAVRGGLADAAAFCGDLGGDLDMRRLNS